MQHLSIEAIDDHIMDMVSFSEYINSKEVFGKT